MCLVTGLGLLGGAAAGGWLAGGADEPSPVRQSFADGRALWHSIPVDTLFPRRLGSEDAGPGGSERRWVRIAVAPDSDCRGAFDPDLSEVLAPVGCHRLLRATYVDETSSSVTTVGLLFAEAGPEAMQALRKRFAERDWHRRADMVPRPYPAPGTAAADFGDAQRASWTIRVLTGLPVVVWAVSGFADGRTVADPQPADRAMADGEGTAAAQAGLGHAADGIADLVHRALRGAADRERTAQ